MRCEIGCGGGGEARLRNRDETECCERYLYEGAVRVITIY